MSQTPSNPSQPPQGQPSPFWGNMQPPPNWQGPQSPTTNQPFNPQFPSGQYPSQQGQFPQQGYSQQQGYPQGQYPPQGYPQQQYQQPPMMPPPTPPKKKRRGLLIGVIAVAVVLFACIGASYAASRGASVVTTTTTSSKVGNTTGTTPTVIPTQATNYKVGDVVKVGDAWDVTLNSAKTSQGSSYVIPKAGKTFLILDMSMKNLSSKTQTISSILLFTLRDNDGTQYNITIYPDAGSQIDGTVDAGQPAKGVMVYEVPSSVKAFHLKFSSNAIDTTAPSATWNLTV